MHTDNEGEERLPGAELSAQEPVIAFTLARYPKRLSWRAGSPGAGSLAIATDGGAAFLAPAGSWSGTGI